MPDIYSQDQKKCPLSLFANSKEIEPWTLFPACKRVRKRKEPVVLVSSTS